MQHSHLTRRSLLVLSAAAGFLAVSGLHGVFAASSASAEVKTFADQLVAIVNGPQPAAAKKAALGR